jgi:hypothetical protein
VQASGVSRIGGLGEGWLAVLSGAVLVVMVKAPITGMVSSRGKKGGGASGRLNHLYTGGHHFPHHLHPMN